MVPLPPRNPAARLESELPSLTHADLADGVLPPDLARRVVRTELVRGRFGHFVSVGLFEPARLTSYPGICELSGWYAWFKVHNEANLRYDQHIDPPLEPYQYRASRGWKVAGSTLPKSRSAPADCEAQRPYHDWPTAPSAEALYRAANLVEQAQSQVRGEKLLCTLFKYEAGANEAVRPTCPNPRAILEKLGPELIKSVRSAACEGPFARFAPIGCWELVYHDPVDPGTSRVYTVTVAGSGRPQLIRIEEGMLPPH